MILAFYEPTLEIDFAELDEITKISHHYTWPYAGDLWMTKRGFQIQYIEMFDHLRFSQEGGDYLFAHAGKEVAEDQIKHSNITQEQALAQSIVSAIQITQRIPTMTDITTALDAGALVTCNVNSHALIDVSGYEGHAVLIIGYTADCLILHDPGLPAHENWHITHQQFERAWAYPYDNVKNMTIYCKHTR